MSAGTPPWTPTFTPLGQGHGKAADLDPKCLLRVVSYNILAQAYVKSESFPTSPRSCLRWKNRSQAVLSSLLSLDADLLCLQELDEFHTFYSEALHKEGYENVYVQRGNQKRDGCGIFFRRTKVLLLADEVIDYNDLVPPQDKEGEGDDVGGSNGKSSQERGDMNDIRIRLKRDCVGIFAAFRLIEAPSRIIIMANTHIFWDPVLIDVKLAQVEYLATCLLVFLDRVVEEFKVEPFLLVAGDFNSLPGDTVYNYITSGVGLCGKQRDLMLESTPAVEGLFESQPNKSSSRLLERIVERDVSSLRRYPLPLVSLYAHVDEEPAATNFTYNFVGTLDYIFFIPTKHWKPRSIIRLPKRDDPDVACGLPNNYHPSDHLPIGSDFAIF